MLEIAARLLPRLDAGASLVVVTAIGVDGSMPRTLGTSMSWDGSAAIGSIAGGCIEGAIVEVAERVLDDGRTRVVSFGVSDEAAFGVGLACGGEIRLHLGVVRPTDAVVQLLRDAAAGAPTSVALTDHGFAVAASDPLFVDAVEPPARMIIVGAMEFSAALSAAAQVLGYAVTVVDPREVFTTPERFPGADLVVEWPPDFLARTPIDDRTVICHLGHDDRYDADLLAIALASPAAYVGAMGSRRTTDARRVELDARGVDHSRLHAPIGLDLGATTPEQTAVSILAEILATTSGRLPEPLRATQRRIRPQ
ncbi:XdhC family protein [Pseudolysinimonas yzui]|uniref:XdhC/CoxI family protein n=1 Tax=Pseudolysinimonas yzui TaxID=2708254 RepID=A0A8J3DTW5_9MICO|nr:XdhC/CoxI family protein [Pseudolysinimonas yzui]GHF05071.1 XdhC/CoxI family protein [Pseudolysinimonas yzui]